MTAPPCPGPIVSDFGPLLDVPLRRLCKDGPYVVYHYSDEVDRGRFWTFAGAVERIQEGIARGCSANGYHVVNYDLADGGYGDDGQGTRDGLTEEEHEALYEAMS